MTNSDRLYLGLYYILKFLVSVLPKCVLNFIAKIVAKITFHLNKKHRKIISKNLELCFPNLSQNERDKISLRIYQNFAKFGLDCIDNQNTSKEKILKKVVFDDDELIQKALKSKKALIFTTAHYGNWELLSLACALKLGAISIVGRELDSKVMDKILSKNRTQFDIELINKKGGLRQMLKALKNGRVLGILTDQDANENESMRVKFFDKEVNFIVGASVIAKKMDALMMSCFIYQKEGRYHIKCFEPIDASTHSKEELTLYQAKNCEEMIKFKPDEYFFFHKRFRSFDKNLYQGLK